MEWEITRLVIKYPPFLVILASRNSIISLSVLPEAEQNNCIYGLHQTQLVQFLALCNTKVIVFYLKFNICEKHSISDKRQILMSQFSSLCSLTKGTS